MNLCKILKLGLIVMSASLFIVSCSDDDSLKEEEKVETIEPSMEITVDGRSITTDAYAVYCAANGNEGLIVSNKQDLLSSSPSILDFEEGDFRFQYFDDGTVSYTIGGVFFDAATAGLEFNTYTATTELNSEITSNDGSFVSGSMDGDLFAIDTTGAFIQLPIDIEYVAEIIGTSDLCD